MDTDLYFDLHLDYASRRIVLRGEFDLATAQCLTTAVSRLRRIGPGDITIDLKDVTYLDEAGVAAILDAQRAQLTSGERLSVTGVSHRDSERSSLSSRLAAVLLPEPAG